MTGHAHGSPWQIGLLLPFAIGAALYLGAALRERRTGRGWPARRIVSWCAGLLLAVTAFVGPLAQRSAVDAVAHMAAHLLVGMLAPLLLVLAEPVTLALRSLDVVPARRLTRLLRSAPARVLAHPLAAASINLGGLALILETGLFVLMREQMLVHVLVTAHLLAAGLLFTTSLLAVEPNPHRARLGLRMAVLIAALAAHGVLAKRFAAQPPPGVSADEALAAAQLMLVGGDLVDAALIALLCAEWYRGQTRAMRRSTAVRSPRSRPRRAGTRSSRSGGRIRSVGP